MSVTAVPGHALASVSLPLEEVERSAPASHRDTIGRVALVLADLAAVSVALLVVASATTGRLTPWALALLPLFVLLAKMAGLYDRDQHMLHKTTLDEGPTLLGVAAIFALVASGLRAVWTTGHAEPLLLLCALTVGLIVARGFARFALVRLTSPERVLVIGDAVAAGLVKRRFAGDPTLNAVVVGRVPSQPGPHPRGGHLLGTLDELPFVLKEHRVERAVVAATRAGGDDVIEVIRLAKACGVKVAVLPRLLEIIGSSVEFDNLGGRGLLSVRRFGLTRSSRLLKRAFDLIVASLLLIVFAPFMLVVAVAVKLSSPGSVVFRQTRIGRNRRAFEMLKFRTMVAGADERKHELRNRNEAPPLFKIANDPRTTRVGRFLRRHSLDELPQLINVLRGDMSIVGPRPLVADEDSVFTGWERLRYSVGPGVTGAWQVLGSSRVPLHEMVTLDYLYCANWSLWLDIKLMARTVPYVMRRRSDEYETTALR
jgi:exopolysaccharide biosynthesis polyprenyl glycosylphosphotransferase